MGSPKVLGALNTQGKANPTNYSKFHSQTYILSNNSTKMKTTKQILNLKLGK